jgi:FlaA1/EpsC-like NDP-sugar epimerase
VLIVGAGEYGQMAAWLMQKSAFASAYVILGMVDDDMYKHGMLIDGYPVLGGSRELSRIVKDKDVGLILFAISNINPRERERILAQCRKTSARVVIMPDILQILHNQIRSEQVLRPYAAD